MNEYYIRRKNVGCKISVTYKISRIYSALNKAIQYPTGFGSKLNKAFLCVNKCYKCIYFTVILQKEYKINSKLLLYYGA